MNNIEEIEQVAVSTFLAILKNNAGDNGKFRMLITTKIGDEIKPLLLIGTVKLFECADHCLHAESCVGSVGTQVRHTNLYLVT